MASGEHFDIQERKRLGRSQRRQNTARLHVRILKTRPGILNGEPARRTCHIAGAHKLSNIGKGLQRISYIYCAFGPVWPFCSVAKGGESMEYKVHDVTGTILRSLALQRNDNVPSAQLSNKPQATRYASRRCLGSVSRPCPSFLDPPSPWGTGETLELELIVFSTGARVRRSMVQVSYSVV